MTERRLLTVWEGYQKAVIPAAGENQISWMRRSFYAGAQAFLGIVLKSMDMSTGEEPTEADMKVMDELEAELKQFWRDVREGKA